MIRITVLAGRQAGKPILIGAMPASEMVKNLRHGTAAVNPEAQRSLAKGAHRESTQELLDDERVHKTPRMKRIVGFFKKVMDQVERGENTEGFFGSVELVIPEEFAGGRVRFVKVKDEIREDLPTTLANALDSLHGLRLAVFRADADLGQAVFHIVDGQGRLVGFLSFELAIQDEITKQRAKIRKLQKALEPTEIEEAILGELERELERARRWLSTTAMPFVCYASNILDDGTVVGLPVKAEKRAYVEGNALNSQATKEEVIRYESFSPIVLDLQEVRTEHEWMAPEYIEEESKSVGATSTRAFTLSSLVQAYSNSIAKGRDVFKVDAEMFEEVAAHSDFARAFWTKVTEVFGPYWVPEVETPGERLDYLRERRSEQNVAFQAVFLQALGRLGYTLGVEAGWDPDQAELARVDLLDPERVDYRAQNENGTYNRRWVNTMMKQAKDPDTGEYDRFVFNNTRENVQNTWLLLGELAGFDPQEVENEAGNTSTLA